ncbi:MAG: T9SS type A sorting domain-containing protein [Ignavibacteriae bacterium]|nr:T9SS type A sorting domain-containing protein [Ignavibacteriota bacterium]
MKKRNLIFLIFLLILTSISVNSQNIKWEKVFKIDTSIFKGIDNADTLYCMALASFGPYKSILKSTDAGISWNYMLREPFDDNNWYKLKEPFDIAYPTRDFCVISCDSNFLFRTKDGGKTWDEIRTYDLPYYYRGFFQISMLDERNGLAIAYSGLALTHNGFDSLEIILPPKNYSLDCATLAAPNSICVVSEILKTYPRDIKFFRSDDDGKTWNEYDFPDYSHPNRIKFVDSLTGFVVGQNRTGVGDIMTNLIYKTIDGGKTWLKVLDTTHGTSGLQQFDFFDKDNGIAVGQFGYIYWTHNGGNTWMFDSCTEMLLEYAPTLYVSYVRKDRAIIVDFLGRIFISEDTTTEVVEEIPSNEDFVIYPNPASDKIKIKLKDEFINQNIQIITLEGIVVLETEFKPEIDVSGLISGVYFLRIGNEYLKFIKL